jgi:hypothetical protein
LSFSGLHGILFQKRELFMFAKNPIPKNDKWGTKICFPIPRISKFNFQFCETGETESKTIVNVFLTRKIVLRATYYERERVTSILPSCYFRIMVCYSYWKCSTEGIRLIHFRILISRGSPRDTLFSFLCQTRRTRKAMEL